MSKAVRDALLDRHIDNFLESFRAQMRPFMAGEEVCIYCSTLADTYCENCLGALCAVHADSETYYDVDICSDSEACEKRLERLAAEKEGKSQ